MRCDRMPSLCVYQPSFPWNSRSVTARRCGGKMSRNRKGNSAGPVSATGSQMTVATSTLQLVDRVSYNVQQEVIVITRDKTELCLTKHVKSMEQRQAWLVPFTIFIGSLTTLVTSNFH